MTKRRNVFKDYLKGVKAPFTPYFYIYIFLLTFLGCSNRTSNQKVVSQSYNAELYVKASNKDSIRKVITEFQDTQAKNNLLFEIAYYFYKEKDSSEFRYWNKKAFHLSMVLRDTLKTAEAHWDLANFYHRNEKVDSSFFHYRKAAQYYNLKEEIFLYARMLLNISILQKNIKDYTNSEANTLTALKIILPLKEHRQIYIGYNNLGILYNQLSEYQNAIIYHNKALLTAKELSDNYLVAASLNNIGVVYEKMGRYEEGISQYQQALEIEGLANGHVRLFAMIKDNLAYSRLKLGQDNGVLREMLEALRLREIEGHEAGIAINKLHLGEYFLTKGDTLQSINYFFQAKELAEGMQLHRDILQSLLYLSRSDKENSNAYLEDYIILQDSLEQNERSVRSKFARIELETDEFIAENKNLASQRKWILGGAGSILTFFIMFFIIWRQKANNKKLMLEKKQQKANEEIYNLLLDQEKKIEAGRFKEKERISRELHDGVLGEMYGIRFNLTNLNSRSDKPALKFKEDLLNRLQKTEEDIRLISRDLQKNEILEEVGFLNLISQMCLDFPKRVGVKVKLTSDEKINWSFVSNQVKMNLYRIIQEALHNIEKYASAEKVEISFINCYRKLVLNIKDNGEGFNVLQSSPGIGIKNMKSRVSEMRGTFDIQSGNVGTEITIKIPINEQGGKNIDD